MSGCDRSVRCLDIMFAFAALVLLAPLIIVICIVLRLTGEGEVLFRQKRIGLGGRPFEVWKFATMIKDSPGIGPGTITVKDDPRVLPFGRVLRRTKINELPQLVNVLKGEMCIIGPRPQTEQCFRAYPASIQAVITSVRPGLSGIGSIMFWNEEALLQTPEIVGEMYDRIIMPYKGRLEEWYVKNYSVKTYLLLMFMTAWVLLTNRRADLWRVFPDLPSPPEALAARLGLVKGGGDAA